MNLTPKQRDLMRFLQRYVDEHACCPTFSEMQEALGLASKSGIDRLLSGLERRGFVQRLPHMQRAITILKRVKEPEDDARAAYKQTLQEIAAGDGVYGAQAPRVQAEGAQGAGEVSVSADYNDYDDYSEHVDCWQCGGEGGWNSCMEDTCCAIGGEEGCDDPACWRRCDICKGEGGWTRKD